MAVLLAMVVDALGLCVTTLWDLQERRFSTIFETVSSAARSVTMALVFCFLSVHRHRIGDFGVAFI